eukprot:COSAG01_NODE_21939_length_878_cov_1.783055_1_plen_81_part_10
MQRASERSLQRSQSRIIRCHCGTPRVICRRQHHLLTPNLFHNPSWNATAGAAVLAAATTTAFLCEFVATLIQLLLLLLLVV